MQSLNRSTAVCATSALNEHIFLSLAEARGTIEAWRDDYNHRRPHSSLGALTPVEFAQLRTEKLIPPHEGETTKDSTYDLTNVGGGGHARQPGPFPETKADSTGKLGSPM
jgi:hypothetical protein